MDYKLVVSLLVLGSGFGTMANYQKTGNHFGNEEDSLADFTAYVHTMGQEWEELVSQQDAEDIARKYSIDSVWVHPVFGRITTREGVYEAYQALFDVGITSAKATFLGSAYIGDNYAYALLTEDFQNKDGKTILMSEVLLVFRQLKEGGFQVLFKSETYIDEKEASKRSFLRRMLIDM